MLLLTLALLLSLFPVPARPGLAQGGGESLGATPTPPAPLAGPLLAGDLPDNAGIFLYDLANGTQRELTFGRGRHWMGGFAPDGCRFVFVLDDPSGGAMRLYTARLDGGDPRPLLDYDDPTGAVDWQAWAPRWSPAGDRIAFVMIRDYARAGGIERQTHIAWVGAEGGAPEFYSNSGDEGQPVWSPDGGTLLYTAYEGRVPGAAIDATAVPTPEGAASGPLLREADLWLVDADGGNKRRLTFFETGSAIFPDWSPDGSVISFVYAPSGNNHTFWTVPAFGGAASQWSVTWALVLAYDWLPDGTGLLASVKDWRGENDNRLWRLLIPGNMEETSIVYVDDPAAAATDFPVFSADGAYLAFRSAYAVMVHDTFSREVRLLDSLGMNNGPLVWSPAGFAGEESCP